jgi:hypothetical protein
MSCGGQESNGEGTLEVENGTREDAVLRLIDTTSEQVVKCLFVRAHDTGQIQSIPTGQYGLMFTAGLDWEAEEQTFRWHPSYNKFDKEFVYTEVQAGAEVQYKTIHVTLHPVINGNIRTTSISRAKFLGLNRDN